jgi:hypothetical protein
MRIFELTRSEGLFNIYFSLDAALNGNGNGNGTAHA